MRSPHMRRLNPVNYIVYHNFAHLAPLSFGLLRVFVNFVTSPYASFRPDTHGLPANTNRHGQSAA